MHALWTLILNLYLKNFMVNRKFLVNGKKIGVGWYQCGVGMRYGKKNPLGIWQGIYVYKSDLKLAKNEDPLPTQVFQYS
jgi:poly(3-hydroxyalkanoate) synthetase